MKTRITIDVESGGDDGIVIEVAVESVAGGEYPPTPAVIGYIELAKLQYMRSKQSGDIEVRYPEATEPHTHAAGIRCPVCGQEGPD